MDRFYRCRFQNDKRQFTYIVRSNEIIESVFRKGIKFYDVYDSFYCNLLDNPVGLKHLNGIASAKNIEKNVFLTSDRLGADGWQHGDAAQTQQVDDGDDQDGSLLQWHC